MEQGDKTAAGIKKRDAENLYDNSLKILRKLQLPNGGCMATPLGKRYPYIYPRDHSFCVLGLLSAGMHKQARKGLDFILSAELETGAFPQRYDMEGNDASYKPVQLDGNGLILYSLARYISETGDRKFMARHRERTKKAVKYIRGNLEQEHSLLFTPNSVHEFPPMEEGLEVWANAVCCAALRECGLVFSVPSWEKLSVRIRQGIEKYLWNSRVRDFAKVIRVRQSSSADIDPDSCKIGIPEFGILPDSDIRVRDMVRRNVKALWNRDLGGICRYPKYEGRNNGGWGPWPHFTLMFCNHYIRLRDRRNADKYLNWVLNTAYRNELPEHMSTAAEFEEYVTDFTEAGIIRKDRMVMIENARKHPMFRKGVAYIAIPLSWPHAEFIRTWKLYKKTFT
jgi:GH15 family glucan-1,4-alpha-glucosidase